MILYHGDKEQVKYPVIRESLSSEDFYFGFYCTPSKKAAIRRAAKSDSVIVLNIYEYTPRPDLNYLRFDGKTAEWLDFVISCRQGNVHRYDIVEGPAMNNSDLDLFQNYYIEGKISRSTFENVIRRGHSVRQISFHTISALGTLKFIESRRQENVHIPLEG